MLDQGKGFIKVVEQALPLRISIGPAETHGVIVDASPGDEQQVTIWSFDTAVDLNRFKSRRSRDQGPRGIHRPLKFRFLAGNNIQNRHFKNHNHPQISLSKR